MTSQDSFLDKLYKTYCSQQNSSTSSNVSFWAPELLEFVSCFRYTLFTWLPCSFLFLFLPVLIYSCRHSQNPPLKWSNLFVTKINLQIIIIGILVWNVSTLGFTTQVHQGQIFASRLLHAVSMVGILISLFLCRLHGIVSSGLIFNSLFLFVLFGLPELIYILIRSENHFSLHCFVLYYAFIIVQLFLSCFADKLSRSSITQEKPCPEKLSSFVNRITFWWFNRLAILGWRRPLVFEDLWSLNDNDTSESLIPLWKSKWDPSYAIYKQQSLQSRQPAIVLTYKENNSHSENTVQETLLLKTKPNFVAEPSIILPLFKCLKWKIIPSVLQRIMSDMLQFASPLLLNALITFVQDPKQNQWKGYFYAFCMFLVAMLGTFLQNYGFATLSRACMNFRSMLTMAVYEKALKLSTSSKHQKSLGETVNIMSTDIQLMQDVGMHLIIVMSSPFQVIVAIYLLYQQIGFSIFIGSIVMFLLIPINFWLSSKQRKYQIMQMRYKDERIKITNEILNGMKVIKLYAWEQCFEKRIQTIRDKEISIIKKAGYYGAVVTFTWNCAPFLISVASFASFVFLADGQLTPQTAFVSISLFNILRFPMTLLPMIVSFLIKASVSNKRIKSFLVADEINENSVLRKEEKIGSVKIENASFDWKYESGTPASEKSTLSGVNINVEPGQLIAVVGSVGCGKSSMLSAILGEMNKSEGSLVVQGSISYVPQQTWIQNTTLKNNVVFGRPYDSNFYHKILKACELTHDLNTLQNGDETEIGEKGVNLSGGQKQRVNLARMIYSKSDIYLLDDPLSAVDSHVGQNIFDNVLSNKGLLKHKTRIVVTNGLTHLKHFDNILVLQDGKIIEQGKYNDLLKKGGIFADLIVTYLNESMSENEEDDEIFDDVLVDLEKIAPDIRRRLTSIRSNPEEIEPTRRRLTTRQDSCMSGFSVKEKMSRQKSQIADGKLIQDEQVQTGWVKWSIYLTYIKAMTYFAFIASFTLMALSQAFTVASSIWLAKWSNDVYNHSNITSDYGHNGNGSTNDVDNIFYTAIYTILGLNTGFILLLCTTLMAYSMANASNNLHKSLLTSLLNARLNFFETTPLGRILNRCGKDIDIMDNTLAHTIRTWLGCVMQVISTFVVLTVTQWYFLLVIIPICALYYFIMRFYISTSRQLKRLESATRSPIFAHFQETLTGLVCVRAFGVEKNFVDEAKRRLDQNQACLYPNVVANRWLAVRLETIGNLMVFCAALFAVVGRDYVNGGQVGLAISYALMVTQALNWAVRMTSELESNIVAVERIEEYTTIPSEAQPSKVVELPPDWPSKGEIEFKNYSLRYRPDLEPAVRHLDACLSSDEKVGVVGRTGAGKTSIALALFRIVEADSGQILIDRLDIRTLNLKDLRSKLTIIPQEPVLFSGSLRFNLDPYETKTDQQLFDVLEKAHLKSFVTNLPGGLDFTIEERCTGENTTISFGQTQLLCLARALVRKTKILIMDEATASIDVETDDLIQKTIRKEFANCTILTIAHRINTILDNDRIMVMKNGILAEFDKPNVLLAKKDSIFHSMAEESGIVR